MQNCKHAVLVPSSRSQRPYQQRLQRNASDAILPSRRSKPGYYYGGHRGMNETLFMRETGSNEQNDEQNEAKWTTK